MRKWIRARRERRLRQRKRQLLDEVLASELPRYAEAMRRLGE